MSPIALLLRSKFALTARSDASVKIEKEAAQTAFVVSDLGAELAATQVEVPSMTGVDEDMRRWSPYQILEHNAIVTDQMGKVVRHLVLGESMDEGFDPKTDVMPAPAPGEEMIARFEKSVEDYLVADDNLAPRKLRGTPTRLHPVFGPLDAHRWHCMCGFHLMLHRRQLEAAAKILRDGAVS